MKSEYTYDPLFTRIAAILWGRAEVMYTALKLEEQEKGRENPFIKDHKEWQATVAKSAETRIGHYYELRLVKSHEQRQKLLDIVTTRVVKDFNKYKNMDDFCDKYYKPATEEIIEILRSGFTAG